MTGRGKPGHFMEKGEYGLGYTGVTFIYLHALMAPSPPGIANIQETRGREEIRSCRSGGAAGSIIFTGGDC